MPMGLFILSLRTTHAISWKCTKKPWCSKDKTSEVVLSFWFWTPAITALAALSLH